MQPTNGTTLIPHVPDPERCWQAVLARDARRDGTFVYAVRSSGVYCRPSCPARTPRRSQVVFYPLPEVARRCGYRPCRRCRPDGADPADPQAELVRRVCRLIEERPDETLTLADLGEAVGLSPAHLQRTFKRVWGEAQGCVPVGLGETA